MSPLKRLLFIMALTALWSPSFLFIKLAVGELPPFTIVTLRVGIAAIVMSFILLWNKRALPKELMFWVHSAILAIFSSVLPFCLFCYAEQSIESAMAAILNGCSPMFTAMIAHFFLPSDKLHVQKAIGIGLSALGLVLLFAPNIQQGFSGTTLGMAAGATAAFCYAVSHVYAKKYQSGKAPFVVPAAQLISASAFLLPLAFYFDNPLTLPMPSSSAILGVLGLSFFGTIIAFIVYYKLLDHCGPTAISMVACFFPVVGTLLGFLFLGETLTLAGCFASMLIFLGLVIVNEVINLRPIFSRKTVQDTVNVNAETL